MPRGAEPQKEKQIMLNPMRTPWGNAHSVTYYDPQRKIVHVSTASHGGIGVDLAVDMPAHLAAIGECDGKRRWFEEDEACAAVVIAFPHFFSANVVEQAKETLKNWRPEAYMVHFGVTLGPADSHVLEKRAWEHASFDNFVSTAVWNDAFWDIPSGYVYAAGFRKRDEAVAGFLVPRSKCTNASRLVLDGFPRWEPDRTKPYCKPPLAECAA